MRCRFITANTKRQTKNSQIHKPDLHVSCWRKLRRHNEKLQTPHRQLNPGPSRVVHGFARLCQASPWSLRTHASIIVKSLVSACQRRGQGLAPFCKTRAKTLDQHNIAPPRADPKQFRKKCSRVYDRLIGESQQCARPHRIKADKESHKMTNDD